MAERFPKGYDSKATQQPLKNTPGDMPKWGGKQGEIQNRAASSVPLNRTEHPVAQFGANPGMGELQLRNATQCDLSRKTSAPYGDINKTKPQEDL